MKIAKRLLVSTFVLFASFAALVQTSCVAQSQQKIPMSETEVFEKSKITRDPYRKETKVVSPSLEFDIGSAYFLRYARLEGTTAVGPNEIWQLYVHRLMRDWQFFHSVYDVSGKSLEFVQIDRSVTRYGSVTEHFAATLSREYLESHTDLGFAMRFYGQRGQPLTASFPPYWIKGFLRKVDSVSKPSADEQQ